MVEVLGTTWLVRTACKHLTRRYVRHRGSWSALRLPGTFKYKNFFNVRYCMVTEALEVTIEGSRFAQTF